jgi:hypothetical protein
MLLPLPGNCGSHVDAAPVVRPASPTVPISVQDAGVIGGLARSVSQMKAPPRTAATGITDTASDAVPDVKSVAGQSNVAAP